MSSRPTVGSHICVPVFAVTKEVEASVDCGSYRMKPVRILTVAPDPVISSLRVLHVTSRLSYIVRLRRGNTGRCFKAAPRWRGRVLSVIIIWIVHRGWRPRLGVEKKVKDRMLGFERVRCCRELSGYVGKKGDCRYI